jgi:hypothetical protein
MVAIIILSIKFHQKLYNISVVKNYLHKLYQLENLNYITFIHKQPQFKIL